jgi:hypothetical protein
VDFDQHHDKSSSALCADVEAHLSAADTDLLDRICYWEASIGTREAGYLPASKSSSLRSIRESDLACPDQFIVDFVVALVHLNPLVHVDFSTVPVANSIDPRHQVDPVTPFTPHLRGF